MDLSSRSLPRLAKVLAELSSTGLVPKLAKALRQSSAQVGLFTRETVTREIPAFLTSANPNVLPSLATHGDEHIAEIERLLGGGQLADFEFVKAHGRLRSEQHFPIEATLHAYRVGHKVLSHWMREAAHATTGIKVEKAMTALADFSIEYTDTISTIFAAEYVAHARLLAETEGDRRNELLNILLDGTDESDGKVTRLLKRAGYLEQRQSFCVALIQSVDPNEMESASRVQRILDATANATVSHGIRSLIGLRNNVVTAIFSDVRRLSGWTAPQAKLAGRLENHLMLLGPSVLVGLSSDHPSTGFIPKAMNEAATAFDFTNFSNRVVQFSTLPIRRLLLHRAAHEVQAALPTWIDKFRSADEKLGGALSLTLRAYSDADLNVLQAAKILNVHPNTIYVRMQKINVLTGRNGQSYHDLTELLLVLDCVVSI